MRVSRRPRSRRPTRPGWTRLATAAALCGVLALGGPLQAHRAPAGVPPAAVAGPPELGGAGLARPDAPDTVGAQDGHRAAYRLRGDLATLLDATSRAQLKQVPATASAVLDSLLRLGLSTAGLPAGVALPTAPVPRPYPGAAG